MTAPAPHGSGEGPLTTPVLSALEHAWQTIRDRHPDVPAAAIILGSGTVGMPAGAVKLGHFAALRWRHDNHDLPEIFVGGEGLALGPVDVLGTLLHEAAHALAHVRGIRDTSRQGRWHNARYAALARELGLTVAQAPGIGWSDTTVPDQLTTDYADAVTGLDQAITLYRHREPARAAVPTGGSPSRNSLACTCPCGRRIRVAPSTLAQGPITCGTCGGPFAPA
jgi:hypothetical protein